MVGSRRAEKFPPPGSLQNLSTADLFVRTRAGDPDARDALFRRCYPALLRWATGRLPSWARNSTRTDDLVQITLLKALDRLDSFEPRHPGAFLAYLRRILANLIQDEIRSASRRPAPEALEESAQGPGPSPLQNLIGKEMLERYEKALSNLPEAQQEAVILRIELGMTYEEIAEATQCGKLSTARMRVVRGLVRIAEELDDE